MQKLCRFMDLEAHTMPTNETDQIHLSRQPREEPTEDEADNTRSCCCIWKVAIAIWTSTISFLTIVSLPIIIYYSGYKSLDVSAFFHLNTFLALSLMRLRMWTSNMVKADFNVKKSVDAVIAIGITVELLILCFYLVTKILPWYPALIAVVLMAILWSIPSVVLACGWYCAGHDLHERVHEATILLNDRVLLWPSICMSMFFMSSHKGMTSTHISAHDINSTKERPSQYTFKSTDETVNNFGGI